MDLKETQKRDPLKRNVEKQTEPEEMSPMSPPEAYEPPASETMPKEDMHPFLQTLMNDHEPLKEALDTFEKSLVAIQKEGITKKVDEDLREFFRFFDVEFIRHNRKEERELFPLLRRKLIANGEHSNGPEKTTAVEKLEEDHIKAIQQLAIVFNFLGLAFQLKDRDSQLIVLDTAIQQGKSLVEDVRLHIFREENIVFPLANKYITGKEFELLALTSGEEN